MDGNEPKMGQPGFQDRIRGDGCVEPVQKCVHLFMQAVRRRRLEMDMLLTDRTGDDDHRAGAVVTPSPGSDLGHTAAPRGKQRCMPGKEPFRSEWLVVPTRGIEHHLYNTLDM